MDRLTEERQWVPDPPPPPGGDRLARGQATDWLEGWTGGPAPKALGKKVHVPAGAGGSPSDGTGLALAGSVQRDSVFCLAGGPPQSGLPSCAVWATPPLLLGLILGRHFAGRNGRSPPWPIHPGRGKGMAWQRHGGFFFLKLNRVGT